MMFNCRKLVAVRLMVIIQSKLTKIFKCGLACCMNELKLCQTLFLSSCLQLKQTLDETDRA